MKTKTIISLITHAVLASDPTNFKDDSVRSSLRDAIYEGKGPAEFSEEEFWFPTIEKTFIHLSGSKFCTGAYSISQVWLTVDSEEVELNSSEEVYLADLFEEYLNGRDRIADQGLRKLFKSLNITENQINN